MASYNLKTTQISIGTLIIEPGGTGGAISVAPLTDLGSTIEGINGEAVFSSTNSEVMVLTITFLESSINAQEMTAQMHNQRALLRTAAAAFNGGGLPISIVDINGGEGVSSPSAYYQQIPTLEKGQAASDRVFVLHMLQAKSTANFGRITL